MLDPIKLLVGTSPHYHQLKSGRIKYQKSKPANPIWRILVIDEPQNILYMRFFSRKPSTEEMDRTFLGLLSAQKLLGRHVVVPKTVEKYVPGLVEKLALHGVEMYLPLHGFASGALAGKEADRFISYLKNELDYLRETMASCEEIAVATGNVLGFVITTLWLDDFKEFSKSSTTNKMAYEITRSRGRDPEVASKRRDKEFWWGPLVKGKQPTTPKEILDTLLDNPNPLMYKPELWDMIEQLKNILTAESDRQIHLIQQLGASAVLHQISSLRRRKSSSFLFDLHFYLQDKSLLYLIRFGMKEAFKMLVAINSNLLQASAAIVEVSYPKDCVDLTLQGIPGHYHLEKMIQKKSGGKIAILPKLASFNPETPEFLQDRNPFTSLSFSARTQISPAQCLIPTAQGGSQRNKGLLIVLALLPQSTRTSLPIGDSELAWEMTVFTNERLNRNGKGVTCKIGPLIPYGDLFEIGEPPEDLLSMVSLSEIS